MVPDSLLIERLLCAGEAGSTAETVDGSHSVVSAAMVEAPARPESREGQGSRPGWSGQAWRPGVSREAAVRPR